MPYPYKTTFNYLLTHRVIPHFFFTNLDLFYKDIIVNPDKLQLFMQKCMDTTIDLQKDNPDIEPAFEAGNFRMKIYGDDIQRSIISVFIPNCRELLDCSIIAFPCAREYARYFTCELSVDIATNEKFKIMGEWAPNQDDFTHYNYGMIDKNKKDSFHFGVINLIYGNKKPELKPADNKEIDEYDKADILENVGWSFFKNGKIKEALDCFKVILEIEETY